MTEIEKKANALMNEVCKEHGFEGLFDTQTREHGDIVYEGLCRAIEQNEAYKQEVSEFALGAKEYMLCVNALGWQQECDRFIIPKPTVDLLAEAWIEATGNTVGMEPLNEALAKRGLKIVETGQ